MTLTGCESMVTLHAPFFLSARRCSTWCSASRTRCHAPDKRQRRNRAYTLAQWPNSLGSRRHWQPVLSTYKMALTSQHTSQLGGRPPLGPGMYGPTSRGCSMAHCRSVRSLGCLAGLSISKTSSLNFYYVLQTRPKAVNGRAWWRAAPHACDAFAIKYSWCMQRLLWWPLFD